MNTELKNKIIDNNFTNIARLEMRFDNQEYNDLCFFLKELADKLSESTIIDKELASTLYGLPLVVRNIYLSFVSGKRDEELPEIALQFEDAWIELDGLVLEILC